VGITVSGLSSGIDYDSLVTKLMAIEKEPLNTLQKKESSYQSKLTALGSLKSSLATFQSAMKGLAYASKYQTVKVTAADAAVASATASSIAKPGSYSLEVTQLAQAQKLVAVGQKTVSDAIGNGVITFDFGTISGGSFDDETGKYDGASFLSNGSGIKTVTIDSSNNSLSGIRDAINSANIGVSATIVNDGGDSPYRLALTVQNSGEASSLKVSVDTSGALSTLMSHDPEGTQSLQQTAAAQDAKFKIDGIAMSKASNSVNDVISGLSLNLLKTNIGSATSLSITRDTAAVTTAVNSFVSAYNDINKTLKELTAYNAETKVGAALNGDSTVRSIQNQLRKVLSSAVSGSGSSLTVLSQVGVSFQKDGTLAADSVKLQKALTDNYDGFAALFASTGTATDSLISYAGASSKSKAGTYAVEVTRLSTKGGVVGSAPAGLTIGAGVNDTLQVKLDGVTATITLAAKTYTEAELTAEIQSKINGEKLFTDAGSSAKVSMSPNGTLTIMSNRYGSASNASITGGNGQSYLNLGGTATVTAGVDVAGKINGVTATGSGQTLTGAVGNVAEGLAIEISGGVIGSRGMVSYSQGYAYQFDQLLTSLLGTDGSIASRIDGIKTTIKDLGKQGERLTDRLEMTEKRYRAQFTALETLLSKMNTTSTYLSQQLEALASLRDQRN
jgi:flagellar hook-associated protein 2